MRSACDEILTFNAAFHHQPSLTAKLKALGSSPFGFFRGTFHLFARDLREGPFRKWPCLETAGQIVGDLHTENFGTFRAVTNEIVYDINDFDETTQAPYEYDVRRLASSLVLSSLVNDQGLGLGAVAAENCVRAYVKTLRRLEKLKTREEFEQLKERKDVRGILASAQEKSRVDMMKSLVEEKPPGTFLIQEEAEKYILASDKEKAEAKMALPRFLKKCLAPAGARPERFTFQDVAFRIAGCGSLGRMRYAALLGKGEGPEDCGTLRLMEWKEALDSALDCPKPHRSKDRARDVLKAALAFQVLPKRYLGFTTWDGCAMQGREIGANDIRFNHAEFKDPSRFQQAARVFGEVTARAHLVSTLGERGPRPILKELRDANEERWIQRMSAFAVAYADRTMDDYREFRERSAEIQKVWEKQGKPAKT